MSDVTDIDVLARRINYTAHQKGHYDVPRSVGEQLMLMVSELAEALEEHRDGRAMGEVYYHFDVAKIADIEPGTDLFYAVRTWTEHSMRSEAPAPSADDVDCLIRAGILKPEGIPVEMADCLIRILDTMHEAGVDISDVIQQKMAYNASRGYRHGRANL